MDIEVAFQGGGARLAGLLAGAEALSDACMRETDVTVKRLAGTSAGAIAAALFARSRGGGTPIAAIRHALRTEERRKAVEKAFPKVSFSRALWRIPRGLPLYDSRDLAVLLEQWIPADLTFEQLNAASGMDVLVVATELRTGKAYVYGHTPGSRSKSVLEGVVASSSIPFFLTGRGGTNVFNDHVDGMFSQNLPVHALLDAATHRDRVTLAVSVEGVEEHVQVDDLAAQNQPLTNTQLVGRVIETMFNEQHRAAVTRVGADRVVSLRTALPSSDFNSFVRVGLGPDYDTVKTEAARQLKAVMNQARTQAISFDVTVENANRHREQLGKHVDRKDVRLFTTGMSRLMVNADSLGQAGATGRDEFTHEWEVTPDPGASIWWIPCSVGSTVENGSVPMPLDAPRWAVWCSQRHPIPAHPIPIVRKGHSPAKRSVALLLDSPLRNGPGDAHPPYWVRQTAQTTDVMQGLREGQGDVLRTQNRGDRPIGRVEFFLLVPDVGCGLSRIIGTPKAVDELGSELPLKMEELTPPQSARHLGRSLPATRKAWGWTCENLPPKAHFIVDLVGVP